MLKKNFRVYKDSFAKAFIGGMTTLPVVILILIAIGLYLRSRPIFMEKALSDVFLSSEWRPSKGSFGMFPFIAGTFWVTAIAAIIAVPLSLLSAIHLSEYAHKRVRTIARPVIDLLSGIPSVVYGVWGVLVIVPLIRLHIAPWFGVKTTGYTVLAGGIVLAIMVFPVIISVCAEVFQTVPQGLREASLSLGATKWQTVKHVVLRKAMPGIIAAIILGISRVFGETMAVLMVVGNVIKVPHSPLDSAYPLPALFANNYGEMMSVPLYDAALMLSAFVLLLFVVFFNVVARIVLIRIERRTA